MPIGTNETSERSPRPRGYNGFRNLALAFLTAGAAFLGLKSVSQSSSPDSSQTTSAVSHQTQTTDLVQPEIKWRQEQASDEKQLEEEAKKLLDGYEQAVKDQKIPEFLAANANHELLPLLAAGPDGLAIIEHPGPVEDDGENNDLRVYKPGEIINQGTDNGLTGFNIGGNWAVTRVGGKVGYYDLTQTVKAQEPNPKTLNP